MPTSPIAAAPPTQLTMAHPSGPLPKNGRPPSSDGCPKETERPESSLADRPHPPSRDRHTVVHPGKPGHPPSDRSDPNSRNPRNHSPPLTAALLQVSPFSRPRRQGRLPL